jgi:hypothetical protein
MKEREKPVHGDDNPKPREVKRRLKATKRISRRKRLEFEEVESEGEWRAWKPLRC